MYITENSKISKAYDRMMRDYNRRIDAWQKFIAALESTGDLSIQVFHDVDSFGKDADYAKIYARDEKELNGSLDNLRLALDAVGGGFGYDADELLVWSDKVKRGGGTEPFFVSIRIPVGGRDGDVRESADGTADAKSSPYIDIPAFGSAIEDVLREALDSLDDGDEQSRYMKDKGEEYFDQYVDDIVDDTIRSFDTYVHRDDTSLWGNFGDIRLNYEMDHKGRKFRDVIEEIDSGSESDAVREFRDWAVDWFFRTFGTYNIKYKWTEFLEGFLGELDD